MWEGGGGQDGVEWGGKWDNCNSIISKYIFKKSVLQRKKKNGLACERAERLPFAALTGTLGVHPCAGKNKVPSKCTPSCLHLIFCSRSGYNNDNDHSPCFMILGTRSAPNALFKLCHLFSTTALRGAYRY